MISLKKSVIFLAFFILVVLLSACSFHNINNSIEDNDELKIEYNLHSVNSDEEFLIIDNVLYGRGSNYNNLFGPDASKYFESYVKIAENVIHVQSVYGAVLYLTFDGNVYGLGSPFIPALLQNDRLLDQSKNANNIASPKLLLKDCRYFSLAPTFALAIKTDNSLWFWGNSKAGQGCKISDVTSEPYQIAENVRFAEAFSYCSAWIDNQNSLYIVGSNSFNQIGNGSKGRGISYIYEDVVTEPYLALNNCESFSVSDKCVIFATTIDGVEYVWGNCHSAVPTEISKEFPEKAEKFCLTENNCVINSGYCITLEDFPLTFFCENNVIYKKYENESEKKIVKSDINRSYLSSLENGKLLASCFDDNCVYLISYDFNEKGEVYNIKTSLLLDTYAVPAYIIDSTHIAFAKPHSDKELIFDTETGKIKEGIDLNPYEINFQVSTHKARDNALMEIESGKYDSLCGDGHKFSADTEIKVHYQYDLSVSNKQGRVKNDFNYSINNWCYEIIFKCENDSDCKISLFIDADNGELFYIN